ncbi:MAG TPA: hypothetical protein VKH82_11840 [Candidatus Binatia bacterium]|nr:hypothetical protein [Candidatus Binatia bacterium]
MERYPTLRASRTPWVACSVIQRVIESWIEQSFTKVSLSLGVFRTMWKCTG